MGVLGRVSEASFQFAHDFLTEHMLDFLGIFMDVIDSNLCLVVR